MQIRTLKILKFEIPFKTSFKHSSADRSCSESVIVVAESMNSELGYGEGCPRNYVTGENFNSVDTFVKNHMEDILRINDYSSLKNWTIANNQIIDENPSIWCAIETALLDLFSKTRNSSIDEFLGLSKLSAQFQYSAVLGIADDNKFQEQFNRYFQMGFKDFKLKVSSDSLKDLKHIEFIKKSIPDARIRLDANNLWKDPLEAIEYLSNLTPHFNAIEEPLTIGDYQGLEKIYQKLGCRIIVDESFRNYSQFSMLNENCSYIIPNIRISKMGGLIRSLDIARQCHHLGMSFVVGAQVGETSILTRMALSLANRFGDSLYAQEGGFGTYLLTKDIVSSPIMFGSGGILSTENISNNGLGLDFDKEIIDNLPSID